MIRHRAAVVLAAALGGATVAACGGGAGGDRAAFCAALEELGDRVADGDAFADAEAVLATVNDILATAPRGAPLAAADDVGDAVERLDPGVPATVVAFTDAVADELGPQAEAVCGIDPNDLAAAPPPPEPTAPEPTTPGDGDAPLDPDDLPLDDLPFDIDDFPFEDFPLDETPEAPDAPPLGDELLRGQAGTGEVGDGGVLSVVLVGDGDPAEITVFGVDGFDPTLTVRDEGGAEVGFNDDITTGVNLTSRLEVTIPAGQRWTAEIRAFDDRGPGAATITYG